MAISKILLLGLIALSSFQLQSARVIPDDVTGDFNEAVEKLSEALDEEVGIAVAIIDLNEQQVLQIAEVNLATFVNTMGKLDTEAKKVLESLNISESCKAKALTDLENLVTIAESKVDFCYGTHKEDNKKVADLGRDVLLGEFMGYPARLQKEFEDCLDDNCRNDILEEAIVAIFLVEDEVWKILEKTLLEQESLMVKFQEDCLIENGQEYQDQADSVIQEADKCVDE